MSSEEIDRARSQSIEFLTPRPSFLISARLRRLGNNASYMNVTDPYSALCQRSLVRRWYRVRQLSCFAPPGWGHARRDGGRQSSRGTIAVLRQLRDPSLRRRISPDG